MPMVDDAPTFDTLDCNGVKIVRTEGLKTFGVFIRWVSEFIKKLLSILKERKINCRSRSSKIKRT